MNARCATQIVLWVLPAMAVTAYADDWTVTGSMNIARTYETATLLPSGKVMVAGGFTSTCEIYDPAAGTWTMTGPMKTSRYHHRAVLLPSGKVLVVGGSGGISSCELYDPASGTWSRAASVPSKVGTAVMSLTGLADGRVLLAGGWVSTGNGYGYVTDTCAIYDPVRNRWRVTGSLNVARFWHPAVRLLSGHVLVAGTNSSTLPNGERFDPATETWTVVGAFQGDSIWSHLTMLPSGKVLHKGGVIGLSSGHLYCELYDPSTATWSATGSLLPASLSFVGFGTLANGKVLAVTRNSAELYDEASGSWTMAASPNVVLANSGESSLVRLSSGKVLRCGGDMVTAAEIYTP